MACIHTNLQKVPAISTPRKVPMRCVAEPKCVCIPRSYHLSCLGIKGVALGVVRCGFGLIFLRRLRGHEIWLHHCDQGSERESCVHACPQFRISWTEPEHRPGDTESSHYEQ